MPEKRWIFRGVPRFFLGLIVCSKGTVSEKAMALFHLFSYAGPEPKPGDVGNAMGIFVRETLGKVKCMIRPQMGKMKPVPFFHSSISASHISAQMRKMGKNRS